MPKNYHPWTACCGNPVTADWIEHTELLERLLCPPLSPPLSQKRYGALRSALNTLVEALAGKTAKDPAPLINMERKMIGSGARDSRQRWFINPADQVLVWNAILLQGLFGTPKVAMLLIRAHSERQAYVDWVRQLFLERQSVAGIGLLRQEMALLLDRLADADLHTEKLPNPFADALPQMGFGPHQGNLLKTLASQTAALSLADSMMAHYLNDELELAYQSACAMATDNAILLKYRDLIISEYAQAKAFDDLLDFLR